MIRSAHCSQGYIGHWLNSWNGGDCATWHDAARGATFEQRERNESVFRYEFLWFQERHNIMVKVCVTFCLQIFKSVLFERYSPKSLGILTVTSHYILECVMCTNKQKLYPYQLPIIKTQETRDLYAKPTGSHFLNKNLICEFKVFTGTTCKSLTLTRVLSSKQNSNTIEWRSAVMKLIVQTI